MNLEFKRKLPTLQEIKAMYPLDDALAAHKKDTDATLKNIFSGKDNRLLLVIGPCSADRDFVRIMEAPSFMRRSASPRSRAPQTNGTANFVLSMWYTSSAGESTSDSSM